MQATHDPEIRPAHVRKAVPICGRTDGQKPALPHVVKSTFLKGILAIKSSLSGGGNARRGDNRHIKLVVFQHSTELRYRLSQPYSQIGRE